jgi:hypothetical protein
MVKLFNLDFHVAVIADIKNILKTLYGDTFEVTDWTQSGMSWLFNREMDLVDVVTPNSWVYWNHNLIRQFHERYDAFLSQFDGFIVTHTPVFCMLFEKYQKPIILINSCRYFTPFCWTHDEPMWNELDECLRRLQSSGRLIAVSNNKGDQDCLQQGANVSTTLIPGLCLYTQKAYNCQDQRYLISGDPGKIPDLEGTLYKTALGPKYSWEQMYQFRGIIHMPYEISVMSLFEQYSANIPLILPSKRLLKELIRTGRIVFISPYMREPYPARFKHMLQGPDWIDFWVDRADYYDTENMKYLTYYDTFEELRDLVEPNGKTPLDTAMISEQMKQWNQVRQSRAYQSWADLIDPVFNVSRSQPVA